MKRVVLLAASCLLCLAAGCVPSERPGGHLSLRVAGDAAAVHMVRVLAAEYQEREGVRFVYPAQHACNGAESVYDGEADLYAVARRVDPSERSAGLQYVPVSVDCLAVVTHPSAGVRALTAEQVRDIYAGTVTNWSEVGGADVPIVVLDRGDGESAKIVLRRFVLGDTEVGRGAVELLYEDDLATHVERTRGAIGFISYGLVVAAGLEVDVVEVDGSVPSAIAAREGYAATRQIGILYSGNAGSEVSRFVEWATGPEAADLLEQKGYGAVQAASL